MMLTKTQLEQYQEDGYVVPDYRLPDETIEAIREDHDRLLAGHPEYVNYCPNVLAFDSGVPQPCPDTGGAGHGGAGAGSGLRAVELELLRQAGRQRLRNALASGRRVLADSAAGDVHGLDRGGRRDTRERVPSRFIRGSHRSGRLLSHRTNSSPDLTLNQELVDSEYDEKEAVDLVLEAGQISLHDVFLAHGSEANNSPHPRRGMTLRYMPTTSIFDREIARRLADEKGIMDHTQRTLFLMRGGDPSGRNDFRLRW